MLKSDKMTNIKRIAIVVCTAVAFLFHSMLFVTLCSLFMACRLVSVFRWSSTFRCNFSPHTSCFLHLFSNHLFCAKLHFAASHFNYLKTFLDFYLIFSSLSIIFFILFCAHELVCVFLKTVEIVLKPEMARKCEEQKKIYKLSRKFKSKIKKVQCLAKW